MSAKKLNVSIQVDPYNILEVSDLSVSFLGQDKEVRAVRHLNLELAKGEVLALVGESGSGKSVSVQAIIGLHAYSRKTKLHGELWYRPEEGQEMALHGLGPKGFNQLRSREIAMVFQEPSRALNPVLRCGQQIVEVLRLHLGLGKSAARSEALRWLAKMGLRDPARIFDSFPHQISGGQQQRVVLAIALCCGPRLLLADEPTTALDVTVQLEVLNLLRELVGELELSMIFVTHDLGLVRQIADRVAVMHRGELVESGRVHEVFQNPGSRYTQDLLASRPPLHTRLRRLPVSGENVSPVSISAPDVPGLITGEQESSPILEASDLHCTFRMGGNWLAGQKTVQAVAGVSFSLGVGQTLGLVGESGSGKTTLARCVLGLESYQHGVVRFRGQPMEDVREEWRRRFRREVQVVFQDPYAALNPRMTIGEALAEPLEVHGVVKGRSAKQEKVVELLESVGMEADHSKRFPHQFSGGQRQRLAIARALSTEPKVLICDECVSSLDLSVQARILNLLRELQEVKGLSLLFISHDLSVIRFMCDQVMVMQNGVVVERASADVLFEHPAEDYTRELLKAAEM